MLRAVQQSTSEECANLPMTILVTSLAVAELT